MACRTIVSLTHFSFFSLIAASSASLDDAPAWFNASFVSGGDAVFHGLVKENWLENRAEAKIEVSPLIIATAPNGK